MAAALTAPLLLFAAPSLDGHAVIRAPVAADSDTFPTSGGFAAAWIRQQVVNPLPGVAPNSRAIIRDAWGFPEKGSATSALKPDSALDAATGLVTIPRLEGNLAARLLEPDSSLTLRFDRPVGSLLIKSALSLTTETDSSRQVFRLIAHSPLQGQTFPLQVIWNTTSGEPLPPLNLQVSTPPPLTVSVNTEGISNLGLVYPLQLTFSEPLMDRMKAKQGFSVKTADGRDVPGSWLWIGKQRLRFTPKPAWPASSTIEIRSDGALLRAEQGGRLDAPLFSSFSTGTDRRIFVYLDKQQAAAVENGQVVRTFKVSTGKPKTPTTAGDFYIYDRYLRKTMRSRGIPKGQPGYYEVEDVPYTQFFKGDLALHGAFWHNGFGHPASHGCVNLSTREKNKRWPNAAEDAGWLYGWASLGVPVTVYKDTPVEMAVK